MMAFNPALFDPTLMLKLKGQVAVVTGGSGGLGRAMALALGQAGARVAVLSRSIETSAPVAESIKAQGGEAVAVVCDVMERSSVASAHAEVTRHLGPTDILVNGAGGNNPKATTSPDQSFFDLDIDAVRQVMDLNLVGTVLCCQHFGQDMTARKQGVIVNIASMASQLPLTRVVSYSAAKAAVVNFTRWLAVHFAQEYSPAIRVNALAPGFFLTEQNQYLLMDAETGEPTARGQTIVTHTPAGRLGAAEDLLSTLLWLVSPASSFVTGTVIPVDGGFSAFSGV